MEYREESQLVHAICACTERRASLSENHLVAHWRNGDGRDDSGSGRLFHTRCHRADARLSNAAGEEKGADRYRSADHAERDPDIALSNGGNNHP